MTNSSGVLVISFADFIEETVLEFSMHFLITSEAKYFPMDFFFFVAICISFVCLPSVAFAHFFFFFFLELSISEEWGWVDLSLLFPTAFGG